MVSPIYVGSRSFYARSENSFHVLAPFHVFTGFYVDLDVRLAVWRLRRRDISIWVVFVAIFNTHPLVRSVPLVVLVCVYNSVLVWVTLN